MKETQKIDELFRKGLADYRDEIPSQKTKEKIFGKLAYYQYLKWILTSVVLLVFISGSIWAIIAMIPENTKENPGKLFSPKVNSHNIESDKVITSTKKGNVQNQKISSDYKNSPEPIENKAIKNKQQQIVTVIDNSGINDSKPEEIKDAILTTTALSVENIVDQINVVDSVQNEEPNQNKVVEELLIKNKITDEQTIAEGLIRKKYKKTIFNRFEVLMGGNLYYVDKKLSGNTEFESLVKIRKEGEKPITAFSPALEFRYNFDNFYIQSGLQYQKYGEKVDLQTSETLMDITENWMHKDSLYYVKDTIEPPGAWHLDTIWFTVKDTSYLTNKYTLKKNNSYKYVEIPLLIGKRFQFNRLSLEIATGVSFGFLLKADAQILATDEKTAIILNDEKSPYFNALMVNYLLRFSVRYSLNEKWSVFISPNMKYNLGNVFEENKYPIKQNYMLYGIGSGLIYKF